MSTPLRALALTGALLSLLAGSASGAERSVLTTPSSPAIADSSGGAAVLARGANRSLVPDAAPGEGTATAQADGAIPTSGPLRFDELPQSFLGGDEYRARGVVFTSGVQLAGDGSNPTSPVLSGVPLYNGPISGRFVVPGTDVATTVDHLSLDVGYINNLNSTQVSVFDTGGDLIAMRRAQAEGMNAIDISIHGIASFTVEAISQEDAGFAIDNLDFGDALPGITPTRMASFGDSYTSGEGLKSDAQKVRYDCGTDTFLRLYFEGTNLGVGSDTPYSQQAWNKTTNCVTTTGSHTMPTDLYSRGSAVYENKCHRSPRAYAVQIRQSLGISSSDAIFTACSGAVTRNLGFVDKGAVQWKGSPPGIFGAHMQKTDVTSFVAGHGEPNFVTVGIGGNDAGFSDVVLKCLGGGSCTDDTDWADGVISTIHGTVRDRLIQTFEGMKSQYPAATIAAFGYPSVIGDPSKGCGSLEWWFGLGINETERAWLKNVVFDELNSTISDAATVAGITYIDITRATKGHEICSDDEWVNGLASGDDQYGAIGNESFHPNQYAHDAIAKFFEDRYVDPLGRLRFSNPTPVDVIEPAVGQQIAMGHADASPANGCAVDCGAPRGCVQACALRVQGGNFSPNTPLTLTLVGSDAVKVKGRSASDPNDLGTFTTDDDGVLDTTVQLPDGIPTGRQMISISGQDAGGVRQYGTALFVVYATGLAPDHVGDPVTSAPTPTPTPTPSANPGPAATPAPVPAASPAPAATPAPGAPFSTPIAVGPRVVLLGWKGRAMRLQVSCPASATKGCSVSLVVTRAGGTKAVGRYPKQGKVTLRPGAVKTYRVTVPRSVRKGQTLSVRLGATIAGKLQVATLTGINTP